MGKFLVIALASLFVCGACICAWPSVQAHAFFVGQFSVRWIYLIGTACMFGGYKLTGK